MNIRASLVALTATLGLAVSAAPADAYIIGPNGLPKASPTEVANALAAGRLAPAPPLPATAFAPYDPLTLTPASSTASTGGLHANAVTAGSSNTAYTCTNDGTLRRAPNSYVLGWCTQGTRFDNGTGNSAGWQSGWAYGNFGACAWYQTTAHYLTGPTGTFQHSCSQSSYPNTGDFSVGYSPNEQDETMQLSCASYLNVKPWITSSTAGTGYDPVSTIPSGVLVSYAYLSRNQNWAMVRYPASDSGDDGSHAWRFIPSGCVKTPTLTVG